MTPEQRQLVHDLALQWLGTPFAHKMRVKGRGVACGQIIAAVYEEAGIWPLVDPPYPLRWRHTSWFLDTMLAHARVIEGPPLLGDFVMWQMGEGQFTHGGIVMGWPLVIHAYLPAGKVIMEDVTQNPNLSHRAILYLSPTEAHA